MKSEKRKHNHKTFNQAAQAAYDSINADIKTTLSDKNKFTPVETFMTRWIGGLTKGDFEEGDLELACMVIRRAGVEALFWLHENCETMPDIVDVVCKKQHDYGHKNINNFGVIGVGIRLCDKIARISNLEGKDKYHFESLIDSYLDIVGYAIIAVMLDEDSFNLQLKGQ